MDVLRKDNLICCCEGETILPMFAIGRKGQLTIVACGSATGQIIPPTESKVVNHPTVFTSAIVTSNNGVISPADVTSTMALVFYNKLYCLVYMGWWQSCTNEAVVDYSYLIK